MTIKLIHIGFPKASSSYLQQVIFRFIRKKKRINFYSIGNIDRYYDFNYINENEDYIISCEHLAFNFYQLDESYEYTKMMVNNIKSHFGLNAQILLVLREPSELIASIYNQYARSRIGYPKSNKKNFKKYISFENFLHNYQDKITYFSYHKIISLFEKEFKNTFIIKHENLHDNMNNIFPRKSYSGPKVRNAIKRASLINRSLSDQALLLTFRVNKFLSFLHLDLNSIDKLIHVPINIFNHLRPTTFKNRLKKKVVSNLMQEKEYWNRIMYYLDRKFFKKNNHSNIFKTLMPEESNRLREEYDSIIESKIHTLIE